MKRFCATLLLLLPVAACDSGTVKDTLGISRKAPDEFRVVSRPPLSVPPEFNLRPPATAGEAVNSGAETPAHQEAQSLVMGDSGSGTALKPGSADTAVMPVTADDPATPGDAAFLQNAGAAKADSTIRQTLQQEEADQTDEDRSLIDKLSTSNTSEPVVRAKEESDRLKENKQAGKPANEGDTPMTKPKDKGPLGNLLGY